MLDQKVKYTNASIPQIQRAESTNTENIKEELPISYLLLDDWL